MIFLINFVYKDILKRKKVKWIWNIDGRGFIRIWIWCSKIVARKAQAQKAKEFFRRADFYLISKEVWYSHQKLIKLVFF